MSVSAVRFVEPASVEQACDLLAADPSGSKVISGGTAVVLMMRQGLIAPDSLISVSRIPTLRGLVDRGDRIVIGAATSLAEVAASAVVRERAPSLANACALVGNQRVRNVATLGGNLAEADYASDPPAALASLGARCQVVGPNGNRVVPVTELITGFYETVLGSDELISQIEVPLPVGHREAVYMKFRTRSSEDRACVGVAARADFVEGRLADLDVVVAAVAATLQRRPGITSPMVGRVLDEDIATHVADRYAEAIHPLDDARGSSAYRQKMIRVFVRRALMTLADRSRQARGGDRA